MHYKKKPAKKSGEAKPLPFETQTSTTTAAPAISPVSNAFGTRPTPVGIFGRQPIAKPQQEAVKAPSAPAYAPAQPSLYATAPTVAPAPASAASINAALERMLKKGDQFIAMKQYTLAEQMFVTFIQRCDNTAEIISAQLKLLSCHMDEGAKEKATARLNEMVAKMRAGEYVFDPEQKRTLAEYKMRLMKM